MCLVGVAPAGGFGIGSVATSGVGSAAGSGVGWHVGISSKFLLEIICF